MTRAAAPLRRLALCLAALTGGGALVAGVQGAEAPAASADGVAVRASITPREHFFADRVTARVEVTLDRRLVEPDAVRLLARFSPFRRTGPIERTRRDAGATTVLTYTVPLQCIDRACLAESGESTPDLAPAVVQYFLRSRPTPTGRQARWPEVTVTRRLHGGPAAPVRGRVDVLPEVSYRVPPAVLGWLLAGAAAALALGAAAAAAARLRPRPQPAGPAETPRELTPESVLELVERAADEDARRMALDELALSLSGDGLDPLADTARRLAWGPSPPPPDETRRLAEDVRRALEERR